MPALRVRCCRQGSVQPLPHTRLAHRPSHGAGRGTGGHALIRLSLSPAASHTPLAPVALPRRPGLNQLLLPRSQQGKWVWTASSASPALGGVPVLVGTVGPGCHPLLRGSPRSRCQPEHPPAPRVHASHASAGRSRHDGLLHARSCSAVPAGLGTAFCRV